MVTVVDGGRMVDHF